MAFLGPFEHKPQGHAWWPNCRAGKYILLPAVILCILIWIFTLAAIAYSAVLDKNERYKYVNPIDWDRFYDCNEGQKIALFFPITMETVHLPIHVYLYATHRLHPVTALVLSFVCFGCWFGMDFTDPLFNMCAEQTYPSAWEGLFWIRQALAYILTLLYMAYFIYAAVAVHKWRVGKKNRGMNLKDDSAVELRRSFNGESGN